MILILSNQYCLSIHCHHVTCVDRQLAWYVYKISEPKGCDKWYQSDLMWPDINSIGYRLSGNINFFHLLNCHTNPQYFVIAKEVLQMYFGKIIIHSYMKYLQRKLSRSIFWNYNGILKNLKYCWRLTTNMS